ncbi:MAG: hypothetical protein AAGG07_09850 [Planctomycetota bacterium]
MPNHTHDTEAGRTGQAPAVVIWSPRGTTPPSRLDSALAGRAVRRISVDDGYAALAEVCRISNRGETVSDQVARQGSRVVGSGGLGLLLVEPERLSGDGLSVEDVVDAVARYAPRAVCWQYDASAERALAPYSTPATAMDDATPAPPVVRVSSEPSLRLAGVGPEQAGSVASAALGPTSENTGDRAAAAGEPAEDPNSLPTTRELLTGEELAMLLGRDDDKRGGSAR